MEGGFVSIILSLISAEKLKGFVVDSSYEGIKKCVKKIRSALREKKLKEYYTRRYEENLEKLCSEIGKNRLICTPSLKSYALNEMIIGALVLAKTQGKEEKNKYRNEMKKRLFFYSGFSNDEPIPKVARKQANDLIKDYVTVAKDMIKDIEIDGETKLLVVSLSDNFEHKYGLLCGRLDNYARQIAAVKSDTQELINRGASLSQVVESLYRKLMNTRELHPSFILMGKDRDERLNPRPNLSDDKKVKDKNTRLYYHEAYGEVGSSAIKPVWEIIRASWKSPLNRIIVLEGEGGIGKTVTLLNALEQEEIQNREISAIYVPLYEFAEIEPVPTVEQFLKNNAFSFVKEIEDNIAKRDWCVHKKPSLILLLDGVNEIPPTHVEDVIGALSTWLNNHEGVQYIVVSRGMDKLRLYFNDDSITTFITLKEIPRKNVVEYVSEHFPDRLLPPDESELWNYLVLPLYLTIYLKTVSLQNLSPVKFLQNSLKIIEPIRTPSALLWNYMQRELCCKKSSKWFFRAAYAFEFILPRIAWEMVKKNAYHIDREEAYRLIAEAVKSMQKRQVTQHLKDILEKYEDEKTIRFDFSIINWDEVVLGECGVLFLKRIIIENSSGEREERRVYSFGHQTFRDCLAAVYLLNQAEIEKDSVPTCWKELMNPSVLEAMDGLFENRIAVRLWETNRKEQQYNQKDYVQNRVTLWCLLELWKAQNKEKYNLNFSGLDLRGFLLSGYCDKQAGQMPLFSQSRFSKNTLIDKNTFGYKEKDAPRTSAIMLANGFAVHGYDDGSIVISEPFSGREVFSEMTPDGEVTCIVSINHDSFATGSLNGSIYIWNLSNLHNPKVLPSHARRISCMAVLDDGRLISGSHDGMIRVWDLSDIEQPTISFKTINTCNNRTPIDMLHSDEYSCEERVLQLAVSENRFVFSVSRDGFIRMWDLLDANKEPEILSSGSVEPHREQAICLAAMKDGHLIVGSMYGPLLAWNLDNLKEGPKYLLDRANVRCATSLIDGNVLFAGRDTVYVVSCGRGNTPKVIHIDGMPEEAIAVSPMKDEKVFLCGWKNSPWFVNLNDYIITVFLDRDDHDHIAWATTMKNGDIVCLSTTGTIRVLDPLGSNLTRCISSNIETTGLTNLSNGAVLFYNEMQPYILDEKWNLEKVSLPRELEDCFIIYSSPNGEVIMYSRDEKHYYLWNILAPNEHPNPIEKKRIVLPCADTKQLDINRCINASILGPQILIWSLEDDFLPKTIKSGNKYIKYISFLDEKRLVYATASGDIFLGNTDIGATSIALKNEPNGISCITSLDAHHFICGCNDGTIKLYVIYERDYESFALGSGSSRPILIKRTAERSFITISDDGNMTIWDLYKQRSMFVSFTFTDVSGFDFSEAKLTEDDARMLWQSGAKIPTQMHQSLISSLWKDLSPFRW